jgi:hypothetical protein
MLYTTLALLRNADACDSGLATLTASLPKTQSEGKQISLAHILKSNGLSHAIWALRATTVDGKRYAQRMAIDFTLEWLPLFEKQYPDDKWPRTAIEAASLFLDGKITLKELIDAADAAEAVAYAAYAAANAAYGSAAYAAYTAYGSAANAAYTAANAAYGSAANAANAATKCANAAYGYAAYAAYAKIFLKWIRKAKA